MFSDIWKFVAKQKIIKITTQTSVKTCEICGKIYFNYSQMQIILLFNGLKHIFLDESIVFIDI